MNSKNPVINSVFEFNLQDPDYKQMNCKVRKNYEVNAMNGVDLIAQKRTDKPLSILERLATVILLLLECLAMGARTSIHVRGIKIGWIENEFGITLNRPLTVFGNIVYNTKTGALRVDHPLYFLKDKIYLLSKLKKAITTKKIFLGIFGIVFAISGYHLSKKLIQKYMQWKEQQRREKLDNLRKKKPLDFVMAEKMECVICNDQMRNVIFQPCHHMCVCYDCYKKLQNKQCPMCKASVSSITEIFIS
jgi:hypothetical protein